MVRAVPVIDVRRMPHAAAVTLLAWQRADTDLYESLRDGLDARCASIVADAIARVRRGAVLEGEPSKPWSAR